LISGKGRIKNCIFLSVNMKIGLQILSVVFIIVFLVPATGFHYVEHICSESGTKMIVLNNDYHCDHHDNLEHKCSDHQDQCTFHEDNPDCCINLSTYIKLDTQYKESNISNISEDKPILLTELSLETQKRTPLKIIFSGTPSPYTTISKIILLKNQVMNL